MSSNQENKIMLTDEERKYLYLYFKSKNISSLKKKTIKEKLLNKVKDIFSR